ncbi:Cuticlin 1 [Trichuris trichiura]|uniref:Cuticlin 1 n=1 Tax=Trichuris trichiura TaxID=36087 RepID=A0A077YVL6_TRITR|nr:Cuticlin 1 [Trichuris trichiura]
MKPFSGHVYVRGHYSSSDCHNDYANSKDTIIVMQMAFSKCGMRRQRMANPKGLSVSTTLVISFHHAFITSLDRAFNVQCSYVEEDLIMTQNMDVSSLPTTNVDSNPSLPTCTYQVTQNGRSETVSHGHVGDQIYHRWLCSYPMSDMYCMLVHSCTADDGEGELFTIIDENGQAKRKVFSADICSFVCSKDNFILTDLSYLGDMEAGVESQIFKFADKPHVYFTCQIRLLIKREQPSHKPICSFPSNPRSKRDLSRLTTNSTVNAIPNSKSTDIDIMASPILVLDLDLQRDNIVRGLSRSSAETEMISAEEYTSQRKKQTVCMMPLTFTVFLTGMSVLTLTLLILVGYSLFRHCPLQAFSC